MSRSSIEAVSLQSTPIHESSSKDSGKRKSSSFLTHDGAFRRLFSSKKKKNVVVQHALALALSHSPMQGSIPESLEEQPECINECFPRLRLRSHSTPAMKFSTSDSNSDLTVHRDTEEDEIDISPKQERSQSLPYTTKEMMKKQNSEIIPLTPLNEVCISTASIQLSVAESLNEDWREKRLKYRSKIDEKVGSRDETLHPEAYRQSIVFPSSQICKQTRKTISLESPTEKDCISKEEKRHSMTFRHRARSASFFATTARMLGIISRHTFKYKWSIPVNGVLSSEIPNLNPYPLDRLFNQEQICIERMKDAEIVTDTNKLADQLKELGFLDGRIRGRHFDWLRRLHFRRKSEDLLASAIEHKEAETNPRRVNGRFSTLF
ncbi:hypothetical protein PRIPAC_95541 [Pristionchus pacificus]|uniref:Uncharacterized protein n=1 Tax=Pristionchus pacificus TaxID=54126 RepID=A0A2A6CTY3_PRIPA|nr:hypothetical protein PRIPAC_95541 [Pristionchus pacificus]|eukprot:PDM81645.1 hypothetical protein PRIPAC_30626 [Pristionchus pacificus]